jgi:hypothetical protein
MSLITTPPTTMPNKIQKHHQSTISTLYTSTTDIHVSPDKAIEDGRNFFTVH